MLSKPKSPESISILLDVPSASLDTEPECDRRHQQVTESCHGDNVGSELRLMLCAFHAEFRHQCGRARTTTTTIYVFNEKIVMKPDIALAAQLLFAYDFPSCAFRQGRGCESDRIHLGLHQRSARQTGVMAILAHCCC